MNPEYAEHLKIDSSTVDPDIVGEAARIIKDKLVDLIVADGKKPEDYYFKPTYYHDEKKIVVEAFRK